MRSSTMASVCILGGSALLAGVHPQTVRGLGVQVGADHLVSTSLPGRPLVEPHLAARTMERGSSLAWR